MILATFRALGLVTMVIAFFTFAIISIGSAERPPAVTQDFGWSNTNVAGKEAGEFGGVVTTSVAPLHYADAIETKSLRDALQASGTICLPEQPTSKSGVFIGWFNAEMKGWRFPTCIGFVVFGDDDPNDVVFTYGLTGNWIHARGAAPTKFKIPRDGLRHTWTLKYDPQANDGSGAIILSIDGAKPFVTNLPPAHLAKNATLDRFGFLQVQASSYPLRLYVDDLKYDGKTEDFGIDPGWLKGGGGDSIEPDYPNLGRALHANSTWPIKPVTQDTLAERIKVDPEGGLSFYTRNKNDKLIKSLLITPEGSLVAGGTSTNGPDVPLTNEPPTLFSSEYDNATNGARLSWVNDFFFSINKSAGLGLMQSEGQPMLLLRVLALMGRGDSPDIQLGRAGPDNGRTNYGPLEATEAGSCLGKIIFKSYTKDDEKVEGEWTGDIAGLYARNETVSTREKSPASLHFTTAGDSVKGGAWRENIDRMVIKSNGYIAIGDEFTNPTERLHVKGNILSAGNVTATGDVIARGANKIEIEHPVKPGKKLIHAAIEGAESAVYYRGQGQLVNGRVVIKLPDYFEALTRKKGRTIALTNMDGFDRLAVQSQGGDAVKDGAFHVVCESPLSTQTFFWEVKAVRLDIDPLQAEQ